MKKGSRILIGVGCFALLLISWCIVISSKSTAEKQSELMRQAAAFMEDGIYVRAVPLLEEAAGYSTPYTQKAEDELKRAYLALINSAGYRRKYTDLLERQMDRKDAEPGVFEEAANYYLDLVKIPEALAVLKAGIAKTGSDALIAIYENSRYSYEMNRTSYEYVSDAHGPTVQVMNDGLWGIARIEGVVMIPCQYEKISTFSGDRAIVMKDGEIFAVDSDNNRVAKLKGGASDFGNFANERIPILIDGVWRRAYGDLTLGTVEFQQFGMYSEGCAAAQVAGKWGVIDSATSWIIPAEYDGVVMDGLGRSFAQGAAFVRNNGAVYLFADGRMIEDAYEDARPFSSEGYAAVKRGGKWGFIDANGTLRIDFRFDDALSFGQHVAAVKLGELWGYIGISGCIVVEPVFLEAKSFSCGSAPVLTERGWQFITFIEYKKGASL